MTLRSVAQTIVRVAERDAFGREIGEDTLKDMGWSGQTAPPRQEPARAGTAAAVDQAAERARARAGHHRHAVRRR